MRDKFRSMMGVCGACVCLKINPIALWQNCARLIRNIDFSTYSKASLNNPGQDIYFGIFMFLFTKYLSFTIYTYIHICCLRKYCMCVCVSPCRMWICLYVYIFSVLYVRNVNANRVRLLFKFAVIYMLAYRIEHRNTQHNRIA